MVIWSTRSSAEVRWAVGVGVEDDEVVGVVRLGVGVDIWRSGGAGGLVLCGLVGMWDLFGVGVELVDGGAVVGVAGAGVDGAGVDFGVGAVLARVSILGGVGILVRVGILVGVCLMFRFVVGMRDVVEARVGVLVAMVVDGGSC